MTTLAADKVRTYETGYFDNLPVVANDIIYQGAATGWNGSGYVRPLTAGDQFAGFCMELADNSSGAAGAVRAKVERQGLIVLAVTGVDGNDDVGKAVYASDDDAFTLTASTNSAIGRVYRHVSSTTCVVAFDATRAAIGDLTSLTDNSGGTAADTIAAIGGTYSQSEVRNAVASVTAKINAILAQLG
jgi:hypothetical protein